MATDKNARAIPVASRALVQLGLLQMLGIVAYLTLARGWPGQAEAIALGLSGAYPFAFVGLIARGTTTRHAAVGAALVAFGCAMSLAALTGGLGSPFAVLLLTLPSGAFSAFGTRGVLGLAGLALLGCALLLAGHSLGWMAASPLAGAGLDLARWILLCHSVCVFAFIGVGVEQARTRATRAIAQERDRAAAANRAKSDFLAMMSHELRTPLAGLTGALSLAVDETQDPLMRDRLSLALSSATSLRALLDDVLDFSRIEAGRMQMTPEPVALSRVIHEVAALFTPAARARGNELLEESDNALSGGVIVDALRLRQVLSNLVGNAIKFTEQGRITLRGRGQTLGERCDLVLEVIDTGVGMTEEQLGRLFEPFVQVHRRGGGGGSGLGLVISRALVSQMGGTLELTSKKGEGTHATIRLSLPTSPLPPTIPPAPRPDPPSGPSLRVLVAEDSPVLRRVIEAMLHRERCEVIFAQTGEEAILLASAERVDLILMDVHMPELDGLSATRRIRQQAADGPRTPIIGLSAGAFAENEQTALEAGMDGYLVKPVSREALSAVIARVRALTTAP